MKASELRIGNWVELLTSNREVKTYQITSIGRDILGIDVCAFRVELFTPVPLTEEILLKAGFDNYINHLYLYVSDFDLYFIKHTGRVTLGKVITDIKYVHQLQNLYYALTGEELTINL